MRSHWHSGALVAALTAGLSVGAFAQSAPPVRKLQLSFHDGRVTLAAQNVTPREIMIEWSRLCGCVVRDGDKVPGEMITVPVLFEDQPEAVVLASILRRAAGYALVPRIAGSTGASVYGEVAVVPVSQSQTVGYTPIAAPVTTTPDDELPPVTPIVTVEHAPVASTQPATVAPGAAQPGSVAPGGSTGGPGVKVTAVGPGRGGGGQR